MDGAVDEVLRTLGLTTQADLPVGQLSGGQRKRASIAVELLPRPRAFFLDEPTSGLDPATAADFIDHLRRIANTGTTVMFTTHSTADVAICDKVVFLARGGVLAFVGSPAEACRYFQTAGIEEIYQRLADEANPQTWRERFRDARSSAGAELSGAPAATVPAAGHTDVLPVGAVRQWALLTRRNFDILHSNRMTLAILVGAPASVILMIIMLFRPGAFDPASPKPDVALMLLFWVAFGGSFFGVAYGLLQICTEFPILYRERFVGLRIGPYLLAKMAALLPLLALADAGMLAVMLATDRLPAADWVTYGSMFVTLVLSSAAALALGLLTSAAVSTSEQATMALPIIGFLHALFAGAIVPVPIMATPGKMVSYSMMTRWSFEGLGHDAGIERLWAESGSTRLVESYGETFSRPASANWVILASFVVFFLGLAWVILVRKTANSRRAAAVGQHRQKVPRRSRNPSARSQLGPPASSRTLAGTGDTGTPGIPQQTRTDGQPALDSMTVP